MLESIAIGRKKAAGYLQGTRANGGSPSFSPWPFLLTKKHLPALLGVITLPLENRIFRFWEFIFANCLGPRDNVLGIFALPTEA